MELVIPTADDGLTKSFDPNRLPCSAACSRSFKANLLFSGEQHANFKAESTECDQTLASLDVGGVNRLLANAHLFDKHISRNASKEGSWFEKTSHTVSDAFQANNLSEKRQKQFQAATGLDLDAMKKELSAGKGSKSFTLDGVTQDLTVRDVPDLLTKNSQATAKGDV